MRKSRIKELEERVQQLENELVELRNRITPATIGYWHTQPNTLPSQPYWCIFDPETGEQPFKVTCDTANTQRVVSDATAGCLDLNSTSGSVYYTKLPSGITVTNC